jgi:ribonuclease HII
MSDLNDKLEREARRRSKLTLGVVVCGIDEVGVGPLAGPVIAAAVVLSDVPWLDELNDSKKLSPKRREHLSGLIRHEAPAAAIGLSLHTEVDSAGITEAKTRAVIRAFKQCEFLVRPCKLIAVVDDSRYRLRKDELGGNASVFVDGGDARSFSVAAASIVAKVARDRYMVRVSESSPEAARYGFAENKGYGTKKHMAALKKYGPSYWHRRSFAPCQGVQ